MKFFSIYNRMIVAFQRSLPVYALLTIIGLWLLFVSHVDGTSIDGMFYLYCTGILVVFALNMVFSMDEQIHKEISEIHTLIPKLSEEERDDVMMASKRLSQSLGVLERRYGRKCYRGAVEEIVYPMLNELRVMHMKGTLLFPHATFRLAKAENMVDEFRICDVVPPPAAANTMKVQLNTPHDIQAQIKESLMLLNKMHTGSDALDDMCRQIRQHLEHIGQHDQIVSYMQRTGSISHVFSVYMERLYKNFLSYTVVNDLTYLNAKYESNREEIEKMLLDNLNLIHHSLSTSLDDYVQHEQQNVSAASEVMSHLRKDC